MANVRWVWIVSVIACASTGCGGEGDEPADPMAAGGMGAPGAGATAGSGGAGGSAAGAAASGAGGASAMASGGANAPQGGTTAGSAAGAAPQAGTTPQAGASAGAAAGTTSVTPPASCAEAQDPYEIVTTPLDAAFVPAQQQGFWSGDRAEVPVAIAADGTVHVGFTRPAGGSSEVVIVRSDGGPDDAHVLTDGVLAGIAATDDGVAALLFDPNESTEDRMWAAVARLEADGSERFRTDLFRSPNLEDVDTKGGASAGRLGYVATTDTLVAYFGHTQRYDDGVRHQGGYLATLDAAGTQDAVSAWFGSHNLEQRLLIDGEDIIVLGLGDAYPKGIFLNYVGGGGRLQPHVIYSLAADGVGTTNGQLGGIVDLGSEIALPFITNRSVAQDLDAGTWPDIDESISMQIREAAAAGTDIGLLLAAKGGTPSSELDATWVEAEHTDGTTLTRLKSAAYGPSLVLIAWAEASGSNFNRSYEYFTMVVDRDGAVCQPRTSLPATQGFAAGDDLVSAPDGSIVWANVDGGRIQVHRLLP